MSGDPMDRDRYPNRPDHPDFWKLCDVLLQQDGSLEDGGDFEVILSEVVDPESLAYVAMQRAQRLVMNGSIPMTAIPTYAAIFLDGFTTGVRFERKRSTTSEGDTHDGE
jgi:hypothetical protein